MTRTLAIALMLVACEREPVEKLESPSPAPALTPPERPAPPPPPPPAEPTNAPVPAPVANFIRAHEHTAESWRVTFRESGSKRSASLTQADAEALVQRLATTASYMTGDSGCLVTPTLQIEIARGADTLALEVDCDHLYLSPQGHDGPWVLLSSDMLTHVRKLYARVLPSRT